MENKILDELQSVQDEINKLLPTLQTDWQGQVSTYDLAEALGYKTHAHEIVIDTTVLNSNYRWVVYIHELLHAVSSASSRKTLENEYEAFYQQFKGYEEGIVEALERIIRDPILSSLQIRLSQKDLAIVNLVEMTTEYNEYIHALEGMRHVLGYQEEDRFDFYLWLLKIPLEDRRERVRETAVDIVSGAHTGLRKLMYESLTHYNSILCG